MQNAKDSFFAAVRDRLATVNSERTFVIDGQSRPGILVCENEVAGLDEKLSDVFCVEWGARSRISPDMGPIALDCAVSYKTVGTAAQNGMDRGRMLSAMDDELRRILIPRSTPKVDFETVTDSPDGNVFWSEVNMGAVEESGRSLSRAASLKVYFYPEGQ
jgi:hypothetical protein